MSEPLANGAVAWRLARLERTVEELETKVDRMTWALVLAALSLTGSVIVFALTTV